MQGKYEMEFEICLIVTNVCQLNCNFCGRNEIAPDVQKELDKQIMDVATVGRILDNVDMSIVDSVSLTPVIGDFFLHPHAFEILEYLNNRKDVPVITFTTNLLAFNEKRIKQLLSFDKIEVVVSMYGWDRESYKKFTNKDAFNIFMKNFEMLFRHHTEYESTIPIVFGLRQHPRDLYKSAKLKVIMKAWFAMSRNVNMGELENDHHNFCTATSKDGTLDEVTNKKGVCWYLSEGPAIYPNGDICYCPTDIYKKTNIGNVFTQTWEEITGPDSEYQRIKSNHAIGKYERICKGCSTWKHPDYTPQSANHLI